MRRAKGEQKKTYTCVLGLLAFNPSYYFVFLVFLQKHCFPMKTGYFVHFSVSPFFSPWFLSLFLFHSLSLSILFFFPLPCFLAYCFFSCFFLVLFLCVCFTKKKSNTTFERFFSSISSVWGFSCFALSFKSLSYFCFFSFFQLRVLVNINVFIFQRRPFLKHPVLFCALCKVVVFVKGRFWGQIWLMFEKHCKNRNFSTGLRAL